ncbi:hypothetical protein GCM10018793_01420 [Streptomyces sulfonofaciens]|uniref:Transport-associated OB type 1 domain-containing protein n=1 Tax=Streptomyces sulfonofaciens TaxID=68272 RepID=A0A919KRD0_9ACTN|nr:TOBE domain-containing protein [Streptomyces sulfonofaciens]GHH69251.1 hypothetical protein GCM10018793_01420 [Streptomyces sulfonofaciens]
MSLGGAGTTRSRELSCCGSRFGTGGPPLDHAASRPILTASCEARRRRAGTFDSVSPRTIDFRVLRGSHTLGSRSRVLITSDATPDLIAEITPEAAADLGLAEGSPSTPP